MGPADPSLGCSGDVVTGCYVMLCSVVYGDVIRSGTSAAGAGATWGHTCTSCQGTLCNHSTLRLN